MLEQLAVFLQFVVMVRELYNSLTHPSTRKHSYIYHHSFYILTSVYLPHVSPVFESYHR